MTQADVLYSLLIASVLVSVLCAGGAMLMVGAKLILRQYQQATGINGTRAIQTTINIRTYAMRIIVGVTFGLISILLWAEVPMIWRQWINRSLFVLVPLGYFLATIADWRDENKQMHLEMDAEKRNVAERAQNAIASEVMRTAALRADRDAYQSMAMDAATSLEIAAAQIRKARGDPPVDPLAAVIPEHSSPVTAEQRATAAQQTTRARITAASLDLGLPARTVDPLEPVDVASIQPEAMRQITDAINTVGEGESDVR